MVAPFTAILGEFLFTRPAHIRLLKDEEEALKKPISKSFWIFESEPDKNTERTGLAGPFGIWLR